MLACPLRPSRSVLCLTAALAGCASLPSSGPTARQVVTRAERPDGALPIRIIVLDAAALATAQGAVASAGPRLASLAEDVRAGAVGPGDVLSIALYEVGVALFSGRAGAAAAGFDPSARAEQFPQVPVDERGEIHLPYVGRLAVAGLTPAQIGQAIDEALIAKSQRPQALVTIATNVTNTVFVAGDIRKPSRLELTRARERLLDAVTVAGGGAYPADDLTVRLTRRGRTVEQRLSEIEPGSADDLVLSPGDRIALVRRPRSFLVLGATAKVSQVPFEAGSVSLAEAVARVGGPSDVQADPSAVFLFRDAADGPVIYRLNMLDPASYFLAQRFAMRDKDVIYIANAAANQPSKLVAIVNQLFSPFVTARAVTR